MGDELSRNKLIPGIWDEDIDIHPEHTYIFTFSGYHCKIMRDLDSWTYSGELVLPTDHPDYHRNYQALENIITVHGGLSYGLNGIFKFDCNHMLLGDISPVDETTKHEYPDLLPPVSSTTGNYHYWTFDEVKCELKSLAEQFRQRK